MQVLFDMDGVLAEYDKSAYVTTDFKLPEFQDLSKHYYLDCMPDMLMMDVLKELWEKHKNFVATVNFTNKVKAHEFDEVPTEQYNQIFDIYDKCSRQKLIIPFVYTRLSPDCNTFMHQYQDKLAWIRKQIPDFPESHFIATPTAKHLKSNSKMHGDIVLIDDLNENLENWREDGGTPIKYLNGINSAESWDGPTISRTLATPKLVISYLEALEGKNHINDLDDDVFELYHRASPTIIMPIASSDVEANEILVKWADSITKNNTDKTTD